MVYSTSAMNILFITSGSHTPSDKNLNHFQRVYFLSRHTDLTILARKGADFSASAREGTRIVHSPLPGKVGQLLFSLIWLLLGKARSIQIVVTEPSVLGLLGFFCKHLVGCKWVVDIWDIPIRHNLHNGILVKLRCDLVRSLIRYVYRWADLFIVSILPDFELKDFRIPPEKQMLFENAIWMDGDGHEETVLPMDGSFEILCMRSVWTTDMGLDTLADAFHILREKIDNPSLTIIGRIPDQVRPQVQGLDGLPGVCFLDFVEHNVLKQMIRKAFVCVVPFKKVPDLVQTYPIKVLEYMSLGKPFVGPRIAGISRMIEDGKNGLLFQAGDPRDLASKILLLYNNPELRDLISTNARELDKHYNCVEKNQMIMEKFRHLVT